MVTRAQNNNLKKVRGGVGSRFLLGKVAGDGVWGEQGVKRELKEKSKCASGFL